MLAIIISVLVSMTICIVGTPHLIKFLQKNELGQFIRQDGPKEHLVKRGTPTMGGIMIIGSTVMGFSVASLFVFITIRRTPQPSGVLILFLFIFAGIMGFLDDFTKVHKKQNLGLKIYQKLIIQTLIGVIFAIASLSFPNSKGITPASTKILLIDNFGFSLDFGGKTLSIILFVIWVNMLVTAWTNAVNLTDGQDGLATGTSLFAFGGYMIVAFWMTTHNCSLANADLARCYTVRDPYDLTIFAAAIVGACFGFLWWNASPAKIFMGDTGSLALGSAFAGLSIYTNTEFLAIIIGGVFFIEIISDVIQIGVFKVKHKRVFKMAPIHHHFELLGWSETTTTIRFWLLQAIFTVIGITLFYSQWLIGFSF